MNGETKKLLISTEIFNKMKKASCYDGMIEIETKLFGIEHSYVYYNIYDDNMYILEDLEGFALNDVKLNWFITSSEIIEYARNKEVKNDRLS